MIKDSKEWNRGNIERAIRRAERGSYGNVAAMIVAGIEAAMEWPPLPAELMAEGPEQATMTVMVSPELVKQMTDWSGPVQIKITEIPYRPSACTHMIDVRPVTSCLNSPEHPCPDDPEHKSHYVARLRCDDGGELCTNTACPCRARSTDSVDTYYGRTTDPMRLHEHHNADDVVTRYECADCSFASSNDNTLKQHQRATDHAAMPDDRP